MIKNKKGKYVGMLVYPVFIPLPNEHVAPPDISKAIFFEDFNEGWDYKEKMESDDKDRDIHYYWIAQYIECRPIQRGDNNESEI